MISASKINTYIHCPKKYFFQYVMKMPFVPSEAMKLGSRVHGKIAKLDFSSDNLTERHMLRNAKWFLETMPDNPVMETTYEDKNNPGRLFGDIFGQRAIGIFDFHWPDHALAGDWKTGKLDMRYTQSYDVQAYILAELFRQKYGRPLKAFHFKFLRDGGHYVPGCLAPSEKRDATTDLILDALVGITSEEYRKCKGPLCNWCDAKKLCESDSTDGRR